MMRSTSRRKHCSINQSSTESFPVYVQATQNPSDKYHARARYRAGQCATQTKQWAEAEKHFQVVVDQFDKFPAEDRSPLWAGFRPAKPAKVRPGPQPVFADHQGHGNRNRRPARFMLGECDFAEQKFATAWEHYLESALGYPYDEWKAQGHYQAGRCFVQLKQPDKAREELQLVIEQYPNHALVKDGAAIAQI